MKYQPNGYFIPGRKERVGLTSNVSAVVVAVAAVAIATGPWDPESQWTLGLGPRVPMDPSPSMGPGISGPNGPVAVEARDPGPQWTRRHCRRSPLSSPSPR